MSVFSDAELDCLRSQRLGRLATVGQDGMPHVVPVAFRCNPDADCIDIGGHDFAKRKEFPDIQGTSVAAFVVDGVLSPWQREPLGYVARRSRSTAAARRSTRGSTTRSSGSHPAGSWPGTSGTASKRSSTVEEARILDVPRPRSGRGRGLVSGSSQEVLDDERRGRWGAFDEPEEGAEVSGGGEPW